MNFVIDDEGSLYFSKTNLQAMLICDEKGIPYHESKFGYKVNSWYAYELLVICAKTHTLTIA